MGYSAPEEAKLRNKRVESDLNTEEQIGRRRETELLKVGCQNAPSYKSFIMHF